MPGNLERAGSSEASSEEQFREEPTPLRRKPDQVYSYEDPETGEVFFEVCRWDEPEGKIIRQRTRAPDGSITWSLEGVKRHPLFRERELLEAPDSPLLIFEGEKCVEAVLSLGLDVLVSTNPMGAGKWRPEHTRALEGRSGVVVFVPDCDKAGRDHGVKVVQSLSEAGIRAQLLDLWPDRSDGFDIADFIEGKRPPAIIGIATRLRSESPTPCRKLTHPAPSPNRSP